jgi:hypothetical protein
MMIMTIRTTLRHGSSWNEFLFHRQNASSASADVPVPILAFQELIRSPTHAACMDVTLVASLVMLGTDQVRFTVDKDEVFMAVVAADLIATIRIIDAYVKFNGSNQKRHEMFMELNPIKMPGLFRKIMNVEFGGPREVVRFCDGRIPCSCLDAAKERYKVRMTGCQNPGCLKFC